MTVFLTVLDFGSLMWQNLIGRWTVIYIFIIPMQTVRTSYWSHKIRMRDNEIMAKVPVN